MDPDAAACLAAALLVAAWLVKPYLEWLRTSSRSLEAHVARTSFQCAPGELIPPAWRAPELALSVVVPAFNEERRLPQMLDEMLTYLEARAAADPRGFSYEVIVVDDGSRDNTYSAALGSSRRLPSRGRGELRVVQLATNCGKGFAVRVGMLAARGRFLLMADASGSTNIRDLERLEHVVSHAPEAGGAQIAVGSRHHLGKEVDGRRSLAGRLLATGLQLLVRLLVGGPVQDGRCGFKLFRADVGKRLFASLHLHGWAFDLELLVLARLSGVRVAEVPVAWVEMPGSKHGLLTGAPGVLRDVVLMQTLYLWGVWHPLVAA